MKKANFLKRSILTLAFSMSLLVYANLNMEAKMYQSNDWTLREFFQFVEDFEDGSRNRYTGCVTLGGSCWSEGPEIDQDCWNDGHWIPCGWE